MSETERERPPRPSGEPGGDDAGGRLEAARARVDRLLQAADEAVSRALSEDSERFLESTRQAGGE